MNKNKKEILIIDDSELVIMTLIKLLTPKYKTFFSKKAHEGIEIATKKQPDLILLDILLPELNGYEICRRLKSNPLTTNIPIIFVTAVSQATDLANAFEVGGADYITKPFVPIILEARISNQLKLSESVSELKRLYKMALDANPITGLPGNNSIKRRVEEAIHFKENVFVFYADLDNFKSFNDKYGFAHGDKVIFFTAKLFSKIANKVGCIEPFIGHIGGDDFVLVIEESKGITFVENYIKTFDEMIKTFYTEEDLNRGYISAKNRQNETKRFPIMSISIAGVNLSKGLYSNYLYVNDICVELKGKAKSHAGSFYCIDRRINY